MRPRSSPDLEKLFAGDRAELARTITLVESSKSDHRKAARDLIAAVMPRTGSAIRVGITGVPGVGKSTLIDALGANLIEKGHRVAVLAVDPSSSRTGGAILGDKTRMARLATDPAAFVRPSPSSGTLGGVAGRTREAMLLCEAAGYDVVLVETVGVGQSETAVADLTDAFLVLALPGAGDELQGIKKGVIELADIIAVNKADGPGGERAAAAAADYRAALHILVPPGALWTPPVLLVSGLAETGWTGSGQRFSTTGAFWRGGRTRRQAVAPGPEMDVGARRGPHQVAPAERSRPERTRSRHRAAARGALAVAGRGRGRDRRDAGALARRMRRLLVTAFGPFRPCRAIRALPPPGRRRLPRWRLHGVDAQALILTTAYGTLAREFDPPLAGRPDAVLMIGVAGRSKGVRVEWRATTRRSTLFPDVAGERAEKPVAGRSRPVRSTPLPPRKMLLVLRRHGLPSRLSRDAGRYLCDAAYYRALGTGLPVLFIHIPKDPDPNRPGRRKGHWPQRLAAALADIGSSFCGRPGPRR
jgi:LAO/AO transport system kinase